MFEKIVYFTIFTLQFTKSQHINLSFVSTPSCVHFKNTLNSGVNVVIPTHTQALRRKELLAVANCSDKLVHRAVAARDLCPAAHTIPYASCT